MAKTRGVKEFEKRLKKIGRTVKSDKVFLDKAGKDVLKSIKAETLGGESPKTGNKLPNLDPDYIKQRKSAKKRGVSYIDDRMRPSKPGNVFTGQLMDSLRARTEDGKIVIEPTGARDDGKTNKEVAKELREKDRAFLGLGQEQVDIVKRLFKEAIRRAIGRTGPKK